ncbi:ribonuclease J [Zymomonas mobilis]|uniref:ribonuclease J n=1 Tax=Zymomonas mobilis TaxID=542 RepID=UPI0021C2F4FB|nr:ribonuclease J [Zymomonas mobilis]MCP9308351.1 ribonuclease J [Zymomonas mobilis]
MKRPGKELLFLALGGSGEIGMNANLYGCDGKWVMVDLGITFGDASYPGVEVILPDIEFIEARAKDLLGIVITHGHEDHIGAIPYLAADLGVPIYATPFTAGLIRSKLQEERIADKVKLHVIENNGRFKLGSFRFNYIPLAHSIPEGNALLIETPYGNVFHTGDWKLDDDPLVGNTTNAKMLRKIGDNGVLALVCDSTNSFNEKTSGSEGDVRKGLDEVIRKAPGRVLVTTFASNAARIQTLGQVAQDVGRHLVIAGRSIEKIIKIAQNTGYLQDFPKTLSYDEAMRMPAEKVMIVATGGQGESRAALSRIAFDSHHLKLSAGDSVIFSSRQIPGNEMAVGRIQNALAAKGIRMVTDRQAMIHVSGHPGRPDLQAMYRWIRPEMLIPVHGELRHMAEQARLGLATGIPRSLVQGNGDLIRLAPKGPAFVSHENTGRLLLDGDVILSANGPTIGERRKMAINGLISVGLAVDKHNHLKGHPTISLHGVPIEADRIEFIEDASRAAIKAVHEGHKSEERMREAVRLAVRRRAHHWTGKKPIVDVVAVHV